MVDQYKKIFQACQKKGTNAFKLRFDPQDSQQVKDICSYLCAGALAPLEDNRSVATVKCVLDGSVFAKAGYAGTVCETCQLTRLGDDAMGYSILVEGAGGEEKTVGGSAEDPLGLGLGF
jgi:hypothetical protein